MSVETLSGPTETKANKEHRCSFCAEKITVGEIYIKSTHKHDGEVYDWKAHKHCSDIAARLKMYDDAEDGVTDDHFQETIHCEHDDLLIKMFSEEDVKKYSDVIQQIRHVRFKDKLRYVIRHYAKIDKEKLNSDQKVQKCHNNEDQSGAEPL